MNHHQNLGGQQQKHNVLAVKKQKDKDCVYTVWIRNPDPFGKARRYVVSTVQRYDHEENRPLPGFEIRSSHFFDTPDFKRIRKALNDKDGLFDNRAKKKKLVVGQYALSKKGLVCIVRKGPDGKLRKIPLHAYKQEIELGSISEENIFHGMTLDEIDKKIDSISWKLREG